MIHRGLVAAFPRLADERADRQDAGGHDEQPGRAERRPRDQRTARDADVVAASLYWMGLYLVLLQIGAPNVAAPRTTMFSYWLYVTGAVAMLSGFFTDSGAADHGWYAYPPLATSRYTPGQGVELWIVGVALPASAC